MVGRSVRARVTAGRAGAGVLPAPSKGGPGGGDSISVSAVDGQPAEGQVSAPVARNEVILIGRVSGAPQERELPSGDSLVSWRLVVARPTGGRRPPPGVRATTVDTLDCVAWTAGLRRTARGLDDGDVVELQGTLRRRFWRAGAGAASRCEVEAIGLRRLTRGAG